MAATIRNAFDPGFGVYVHWPFCLSKCPYCDFNSHVRKGEVDEDRFVDAFRTELRHRAALAPGRETRSVFFGGGTPSLMSASTVEAILREIGDCWPLAPDVEVTLEANPTSVEASRFRSFKAAGVNRVSLGVQALNDIELRALGRQHTVAEALAALDVANKVFERTSFDLIYARPQQTPAAWRKELELALARVTEHVSLYQLTIEPETMFERMYEAGKLEVPDTDTQRALWDVTQEMTARAGLPAYEVSNHARPGGECRHNLVYWRYGEYAGVGPGAHGRLITPRGRRAQATERHPEMWLTVVESEGHGLVEDELLSAEQEGDEFLLMGLRLREGIDPGRFFALTGKKLSQSRVSELVGDGLVELTRDNRLRVSSEGFPVLDAVVADLAA
ncbi:MULTISPECIES: radical SAM family heme chaperone HemW [Methylosinus]|uniref:Heme chaperone HemW n=1 Tax=Methylosinus trichosporium (strain ATCC 35070 / NCIMB 11131 / UNIQEM 75 / OB3b) TaxID=595536 RepID=A0A2D2D3X3_METT3|nr:MULTISPECIES: radical SAM family heme chaperone HemW [Methylosinus]ATQ69703.1 coproporphyrinogen III oxidase [Methylosinus trichosporium OB3b]OBS51212.1 coproporphyrinogen III oxidase [Methylosinus sp. 3S-1]